jgi:hypothetical protein
MAAGKDTVRQARRMRDCAEEIRNLAEKMRFAPAKNVMLRLAATYEKLAERRETVGQSADGDAQRTS